MLLRLTWWLVAEAPSVDVEAVDLLVEATAMNGESIPVIIKTNIVGFEVDAPHCGE
jgi:hypothetical protein